MLKDKPPLKILILMSYFNRPKLVRNALRSVLKADEHHQNWHLIFGDDGSAAPGRPIAEEMMVEKLDQVTIIESRLSFEDKIKDGLVLGRYANDIIRNSDADVAIILCDDDELVPTYLRDLNHFFQRRPEVLYCYSKLHLYNPLFQSSEGINNVTGHWNQWNEPIDPVGKVDASQVAWRLDCCKVHGAWFAESTKFVEGKPWTKDTDRSFFENLYKHCGPCHPTGFAGQFKGVHDYQLVWHKNVPAASLWAYDQMCRNLAGEAF